MVLSDGDMKDLIRKVGYPRASGPSGNALGLDVQFIQDAYEAGWSPKQIAKYLGVGRTTIISRLGK